jgi:hypothetical protein
LSIALAYSFISNNSQELACLKLYKEIQDPPYNDDLQTGEREAIKKRTLLIGVYITMDCPDFRDLDILIISYISPLDDEK